MTTLPCGGTPGQSLTIIPQNALYPPFPASCSVAATPGAATQTAAAGNLFSTQTAVAGQTATAYALTVVAQQTQSAQQTQTAAPGATSSAIAQQTQTTQQTQTAGSTATAAAKQTATAASAATTAAAATATAVSGQTATALARPTSTNTPVPPTNTATPSPTITPGGGNTAMLLPLPVRTPIQLVAGVRLINPAARRAARAPHAVPAAPLATPTQAVPDYAYPPKDGSGNYVCPSPDKSIQTGVSPPGASAIGQTVPEGNPFDPPIHNGCLPSSEYRAWPGANAPPPPLWITAGQEYQGYNLSWQGPSSNTPNYRPYNGRWVYLYAKIPDNYDTTYNPLDASGHPLNPNPGYWYVQYLNRGAGQITDRTTWEVSVIDTPPHLVN